MSVRSYNHAAFGPSAEYRQMREAIGAFVKSLPDGLPWDYAISLIADIVQTNHLGDRCHGCWYAGVVISLPYAVEITSPTTLEASHMCVECGNEWTSEWPIPA